jgi:hypothetical protein
VPGTRVFVARGSRRYLWHFQVFRDIFQPPTNYPSGAAGILTMLFVKTTVAKSPPAVNNILASLRRLPSAAPRFSEASKAAHPETGEHSMLYLEERLSSQNVRPRLTLVSVYRAHCHGVSGCLRMIQQTALQT